MFHCKKLFILVLATFVAVSAVGCTPSKEASDPPASAPQEVHNPLKEQYPTFFDLDTTNGLTVYVAKFAPDYAVCALYPTIQEEADFTSIALGPQSDLATMKQLLASYDLPRESITVTPYYSPLSSYIAPDLFEERGMAEVLFALGLGEKPEDVVEEPDDAPFPTTLCWADYTEEGERALRFTYYPITGAYSYQHELTYPAIGIKNTQELDSFLSLAKGYFSLSASLPGKETFNATVAKYDEAFFEENGLVIVYIPSESTSIGYKLADAALSGEELHITLTENRPEGDLAQAMAGWFMTVELPQAVLSQANYFSAGK